MSARRLLWSMLFVWGIAHATEARTTATATRVATPAQPVRASDSPVESSEPEHLDYRAAADRLIRTGTADSLATAALLRRFGSELDEGAAAIAAKAVALEPHRRELVWLAIRMCDTASDCDPGSLERRLRDLDPANGAGWLGDLARARAHHDQQKVDAALVALGRSQRVDIYFNPLVASTSRALASAWRRAASLKSEQKTPPSDQPLRLSSSIVTMIGIMSGSVMPSMQSLSVSCTGPELTVEGRTERCRQASEAFARGDTFVVEGLGLRLERRLWPTDSAQGRALDERRRTLQYRLEEWNKLPMNPSEPRTIPDDYLEVLQTNEREQDAALEYLRRAGIPDHPPADWISQQPPRFP